MKFQFIYFEYVNFILYTINIYFIAVENVPTHKTGLSIEHCNGYLKNKMK